MIKNSLIAIICLFTFNLLAQSPVGGNRDMMKALKDIKGRVYGKIVDAKTKKPVGFASVVVLWYNKDSVMGGVLSEANGDFNVENLPAMGGFRLKVSQIGYKTYETKFYIQMPNKLEQDLGNIQFSVDEKVLGEVEVKAEKSTVVMSIDKRTYNVDKDISVKGGTAADAMKNVPGVTVDADGNAQLRNQSPTIFVDGRPTNLTLVQIPADQIDRIEVITNPSVKYDASSAGGILNIIMKKNLKPGYNGMAMANAGTSDRYGGMLNLNVKEGKWNFTGMYSYNQAINYTKGFTKRKQLDVFRNPDSYFNQDNNTNQKNAFSFGKVGLDYSINNRNTITLNGMLVAGLFNTNDNQSFESLDKNAVEVAYGNRVNLQNSNFNNYNGQLLYKKTFPKAGKEITMDANYNRTVSDNDYLFSTYNTLIPDTQAIPNAYQKNIGSGDANQFVFQFDFVNPISETKKFEAGIRSFTKNSTTINYTSRAFATEDVYFADSSLSNNYVITERINAAYVNYNSKTIWDISYQAGLRFEQSYYKGDITDKKQTFSYIYPSSTGDILKSIFPGLYLSKKFNGNQEWQINFSRKIQRPNFFQLMPVIMFADKQNYRIGNPELKPEFKNITELNYNKTFTKGSYLGSGYFRYEEQPITDVAYPDINPNDSNASNDQNIVLKNTTINGSNSIRYGMEHTFKYTLIKNLDVTLNLNAFYIFLRGQVIPGQAMTKTEGYTYNTKAILSYKFPKQITLQVNGNYESPRILLLGTTLQIYSMDVSINKMFGTKWVVNATLSDAFNTRRMGTHYDTPSFIQDLSRRRESRFVRLTVTYLFGKMDASIFKRAKQTRSNDNQQGSQDGLDFGK
jgi:hypothetical protein